MRDILFRGKRLGNGKWIEGNYWEFCGDHNIMAPGTCIGSRVDPSTVGQYTGLLDKNGKRIFEGDIVTGLNCTGVWTGYVIWIDKIAGFGLKWIHRDEPTAFENIPMIRFLTSQAGHPEEFIAGVIGNIHDDPELLENQTNNHP